MPTITAVTTAVPPYVVTSEQSRDFALHLFGDAFKDIERLLLLFDHTQIEERHFCKPLPWFQEAHTFAEKNEAYVQAALSLSADCARRALVEAKVLPAAVDAILFVSSTGISTPSLDAAIAQAIGLPQDVKRLPIWGLGCAGGASGLARASDYAVAHPAATVLLVAAELCGLTFIQSDRSKSNLVGSALFADGAAAVVIQGDLVSVLDKGAEQGRDVVRIVGSRSHLWPDSEDVMGWEVCDAGLSVIFSRDIPSLVRREMAGQVDQLLLSHGLGRSDLAHFIAHPGGAKVLDAYQESLALPASSLDDARAVLRDFGNMSSPTVLFVLQRFLERRRHKEITGGYGVLAALGPGFSCEQVLLQVD